jgi:hypothetical protein
MLQFKVMVKALLFGLFLLHTAHSFATGIEITAVNRASRVVRNQDGSFIVFGGVAGSAAGCTSSTNLCNNCLSPVLACNEKRINDSLRLQISFRVTADVTDTIKVKVQNVNSANFSEITPVNTTGTFTKNSTGTIELEWSDICGAATGGSTCELQSFSNQTLQLAVGTATGEIKITAHAPDGSFNLFNCSSIGPNDSGICEFWAYPGDSKIYVKELNIGTSTYPKNKGVRYTAMRIFISDVNFASANYTQGLFADIPIPPGDTAEPEPNVVDGLTNGVTYYFRSALIDEANNISYLIDDAYIATLTGCGATNDATCRMMATPSPVYGLLPEDLNCFISTAAYGSNLAKEVDTFRRFRDQFLIPSKLGRRFVISYYNWGAKMASRIAPSEFLRASTRIALLPALWFATLSLKLGLLTAAIIFISVIGLIIILARKLRHKLCA